MKTLCLAILLTATCCAQEATIKKLTDRAARGTLSDQRQIVRGDSGKWNDKPTLQHAPSLERKPPGLSLDDWAEQLAEKKPESAASDEQWLLFRTRQLDDHDRVWIEKIERIGHEFVVVLNEAIWQGNYFKTFTYYEVTAVNLGKLAPGAYSVKWQVQPLAFQQLEKPVQRGRDDKNNWPIDERPTAGKPVELQTTFTIR
jgi:hypothetical protein